MSALSLAALPHYCTDPDVTWGNGRMCPLVVHYWADLQLLHGFHCDDNTAMHLFAIYARQHSGKCKMSASTCLYSLYAWLALVTFFQRYFVFVVFLWSRYGIGQAIIFLPCGFFLFYLSFFRRLISAVADWMCTILPHMVWP